MPRESGLEQDRVPLHRAREQPGDVTSGDVTTSGHGDGDVGRVECRPRRHADDAPPLVLLQYQLAALVDAILAVVRRYGHQINVIDRHCINSSRCARLHVTSSCVKRHQHQRHTTRIPLRFDDLSHDRAAALRPKYTVFHKQAVREAATICPRPLRP